MATPLLIAPEPIPLETGADGAVRVGGTRVTLDTMVYAFEEGATAEEIAQQYSSRHLAEVYAVMSDYLRQPSNVQAYLERRQQQANEIRRQNQTRFDPHGVRERLLARRAKAGGSELCFA